MTPKESDVGPVAHATREGAGSERAKLDVAPFAEGGIGYLLCRAAEAYLADYAYSPDEGADHEPTEFEGWLLEDFWNGLITEESFFGPIRILLAQAACAAEFHAALTKTQDAMLAIDGWALDPTDPRGWSLPELFEAYTANAAALRIASPEPEGGAS